MATRLYCININFCAVYLILRLQNYIYFDISYYKVIIFLCQTTVYILN